MRILFLCSIIFLFVACNTTQEKKQQKEEITAYKKANGDRFYGGIFRMNETEYIDGFFPHYLIDPISRRVSSHIFEGLLKYDENTTELQPCIANYFQFDSTKNKYIFYLKHNIYFHDNSCFPQKKGRELVAEDIAFCFRLLQKKHKLNRGYEMFKNVFEQNDSLLGVKVINKYAVEFSLKEKNHHFLDLLTSSFAYIFPKEAYELYGNTIRLHPVGTGPFCLKETSDLNENLSVFLSRHNHYHEHDEFDNPLPYLDGIEISFLKEKDLIVKKFLNHELDYIHRIPKKEISIILDDSLKTSIYYDYVIQQLPELTTHYLGFNLSKKLLSDTLRKAFQYAINTKLVMKEVLPYDSLQKRSLVPDYFSKYPFDSLNLPTFNVDSAKKYLAKAGYPNGKKFPKISISLYTDGERNSIIANNLKKQFKENLNITIEVNPMPLGQHLETVLNKETHLFLGEWTYQNPKIENFFYSFYSNYRTFPNLTHYKNGRYDFYFKQALSTKSEKKKNFYLLKAEQNVIDNTGVIVLWHDKSFRLLQPKIRNFSTNSLQLHNLCNVYFQPPQTLKEVF